MASLRTEVTEIVTGLAMLGHPDTAAAIHARPPQVIGVSDHVWANLDAALSDPVYQTDFKSAWANGLAFYGAPECLNGRPPYRVEWKGPQQQPGYEFLPADLRVNRVFLISCKYLSKLVCNSSPTNIFDRLLEQRGSSGQNWFMEVASQEYQDFYSAVRNEHPALNLPATESSLTPAQRSLIAQACEGQWPPSLLAHARQFFELVASRSATRWSAKAGSAGQREVLLWRLLRLASAPYFILGTSGSGPLRLRVDTPWDWRSTYKLIDLSFGYRSSVQSHVTWRATVRDKSSQLDTIVDGHVEVRWSHGRFTKSPEAKVYLDTPHQSVPGYTSL